MANSSVNLNLAAERSFTTPLSNSTLLPLLLLSLARQKNTPAASSTIKKKYDYIVVGGGTAGSVVAARLSEIPCVNVLVLEAGPLPPRISDVPAFATSFWSSSISWNYQTTPQNHTGSALINRQIHYPMGKVLGGTSILNGGVHVRGNRKDYDDWAAMGAKGWSYNEVLHYFKKLEDNKDPEFVADGYHGVRGPVTVMQPRYEPEIKSPVFRAAEAMGYRIVDPNGRRQTGFYDLQANLRDGQRCSTAKAYLVPAENRKNLNILPNALVKKILFQHRRATGVLFDYEGQTHKVEAKREVIMSAGAVNTPQLLMLSGIGPKEELEKFNIPVIADLPVGKNFQDHGGPLLNFVLSPNIRELTKKLSDPMNVEQYIYNRTGPLASPPLSVIAFLHDDDINPKIDFPNYQIYFAEGTTIGLQQILNMEPEVYQKVYGPYENQTIMTCYVHYLHPKSVGTITLRSANPYDPPVIEPNFFGNEEDLDDIVEGMKACSRIGNSSEMKQLGSQIFETLYPGCEEYAGDEDLYFRCYARSAIVTYGHICGTAKMGDPRNASTVVDPKLRVKGIRGLRVVDNSIMPKITSGNTGVPAIMIGEKASDIIKESIKCRSNENIFMRILNLVIETLL